MKLIQKRGLSQNRFQSRMAAQRPCRKRGSEGLKITLLRIKIESSDIKNSRGNALKGRYFEFEIS